MKRIKIANVKEDNYNCLSILSRFSKFSFQSLPTMNPEKFPIVDFRVIECLQNFGYLDPLKKFQFYRDNLKGYKLYRSEILELASKLKVDLRQLDKALFAFHKINLRLFHE